MFSDKKTGGGAKGVWQMTILFLFNCMGSYDRVQKKIMMRNMTNSVTCAQSCSPSLCLCVCLCVCFCLYRSWFIKEYDQAGQTGPQPRGRFVRRASLSLINIPQPLPAVAAAHHCQLLGGGNKKYYLASRAQWRERIQFKGSNTSLVSKRETINRRKVCRLSRWMKTEILVLTLTG